VPDRSQFNLTILWDDELRLASRLLKEAHDEQDEDARSLKMVEAYRACQVALWNLGEDALVVIGAGEIRRRVRGEDQPAGDA
jgi:hypothetical protein